MQKKNNEATIEHCVYAFDVLTSHLNKTDLPVPQFEIFEAPIFVTFHSKGDLRGCIGTFTSGPIDRQIKQYTFQSAFKDTRFAPIKINELNELDCNISFLVNFEKNKKWNQWEVGKHGIIIDLDVNGEEYGATFLPEVAPEQGWDHEKTLKSLIRKAGYHGNYKEVLDKIIVTTYESTRFKITYQEYLAYKNKQQK
ncbi:hypothetical protein pb186bvf_017594 [Paramecium bursaria]